MNPLVDLRQISRCREVLRLSTQVCQVIGYCAGVVGSSVLNRSLTFRDRTSSFFTQILLFIVVNAVSMLITSWLIGVMTGAGLHVYLSQLLVTGISMLINYFGYKRIVFNVKDQKGGQAS